jgi:hypothetical protein
MLSLNSKSIGNTNNSIIETVEEEFKQYHTINILFYSRYLL